MALLYKSIYIYKKTSAREPEFIPILCGHSNKSRYTICMEGPPFTYNEIFSFIGDTTR